MNCLPCSCLAFKSIVNACTPNWMHFFSTLAFDYRRHEWNGVDANKFWVYRKVKFDPPPPVQSHTCDVYVWSEERIRIWTNRSTINFLLTISIFSKCFCFRLWYCFYFSFNFISILCFSSCIVKLYLSVLWSICIATRHFYIQAFSNHRDIIHLCPRCSWLMWSGLCTMCRAK